MITTDGNYMFTVEDPPPVASASEPTDDPDDYDEYEPDLEKRECLLVWESTPHGTHAYSKRLTSDQVADALRSAGLID